MIAMSELQADQQLRVRMIDRLIDEKGSYRKVTPTSITGITKKCIDQFSRLASLSSLTRLI